MVCKLSAGIFPFGMAAAYSLIKSWRKGKSSLIKV